MKNLYNAKSKTVKTTPKIAKSAKKATTAKGKPTTKRG